MTDLNVIFKNTDNHKLNNTGPIICCKHNRTEALLKHHYNHHCKQTSFVWQSANISTFKRTFIQLIQTNLGKHYLSNHASLLKWIKSNQDWNNPNKALQNWKIYQNCIRNHISTADLKQAPEQQWQQLYQSVQKISHFL